MSAKNSLKAKQARRAEREARRLTDHRQDNTQFRLIALPNGGYTRDYGSCPTCMYQHHINGNFINQESEKRYTLTHECRMMFLTPEEVDNIVQSAKYFVETEIMKAAAEAELDEDDWAQDPE